MSVRRARPRHDTTLRAGLVAAVALAAGCGGGPKPDAARADSATVHAAMRPWYLDPSEGCGFDTTTAHPDPDRLITEFLERDAAGQFLQTDRWFNGATECPGQEPGPDAHLVIDAYRVAPLSRSADTVRVAVTSAVVGMWGHLGLQPDAREVVDTVTAIRTPHGWRIAGPALRQFVLRAASDSFHRANQPPAAPDSAPPGGG